MSRTISPLLVGALLFVASCSTPEGCPGNCSTVCGGKMFGAEVCAAEYTDGYNTGFCAGVLNNRRPGGEQSTFVAGYWDGYSAGSMLRTQRMVRSCQG